MLFRDIRKWFEGQPMGRAALWLCVKTSLELEMRNGGAAPDPSTQFSLFRLYMIEHPTFHSAQDDEMRREA